MTTIATRRFDLDGYQFTEAMTRTSDGGFVLKRDAGGHPQEADEAINHTLDEVFVWLNEAPQQVSRAVYAADDELCMKHK